MSQVRIVAARELTEAFRSKAFWVTAGLMVTGVVALIALPRILGDDPSYRLGLGGERPADIEEMVASLGRAFEVEIETVELADIDAAQTAVADRDLDAALLFVSGDASGGATLVRRVGTSGTLTAIASQAATSAISHARVVEGGLSPGDAQAALAVAPPEELVVDDDQPGRRAVASLLTFVLYITLFMGGMSVATGVAVDKSSRIAEVLVTAVRPSLLLAGKVVGLGVMTLLMVLAAAVPFLVAMAFDLVDLPTAAATDVIAGLGWFLLGYAMYATGFAALGALVDRQEDLGGAIAPFGTALILAYIASIHALESPDSLLARVTSIFPLTAPVVMPARVAEDAASTVEIAAAVVLCVATFAVVVRVGGVIYRRALLQGGQRLRVAQVLRG